jgi:hypothetical protein
MAAVVIGMGVAGASPANAQEKAPAQEQQVETTLPQEAARRLEERRTAVKALEKPGVTYSGFLVDVKQAKDKKKFFSLRQPVDPKNDYKNILVEDRSPRPRGFLLFSINF